MISEERVFIIGLFAGLAGGVILGLSARVGLALGVENLLDRFSRRVSLRFEALLGVQAHRLERSMKTISDEQQAALEAAVESAGAQLTNGMTGIMQSVVAESNEIQVLLEQANNQIPNFDLTPIINRMNGLGQAASDGLNTIKTSIENLVTVTKTTDPANLPPPVDTTPPADTTPADTTPPADGGSVVEPPVTTDPGTVPDGGQEPQP